MDGVTDLTHELLAQDPSVLAVPTTLVRCSFSNIMTTPQAHTTTPPLSQTGVHTPRISNSGTTHVHFCSSCKKRMQFDAFQRRQNGSLYNTCITCLAKTKQRKTQQQQQQQLRGRRRSSVDGSGLVLNVERGEGLGLVYGQQSTEVVSPTTSSFSTLSSTAPLSFTRTPTAQSTSSRTQRVPDEPRHVEPHHLEPHHLEPRHLEPPHVEPPHPEATTQPLMPNITQPAKRARRRSTTTTSSGSICDSPNNGGGGIPDAYVRMELERLELERRRLEIEQEQWREERAERVRWEQMFREQWQEERDERKLFREREKHIWRLLLAMRTHDTSV